jgi:hypothetical protein
VNQQCRQLPNAALLGGKKRLIGKGLPTLIVEYNVCRCYVAQCVVYYYYSPAITFYLQPLLENDLCKECVSNQLSANMADKVMQAVKHCIELSSKLPADLHGDI